MRTEPQCRAPSHLGFCFSGEPQIRGDMPRRPAYTGTGVLCHSPHQRRRPSRKELQAAAIVWCGESASITVRCVAICRRGARAALRCRDAPTPLLSKEWGPPHCFAVGTAASKLTALQMDSLTLHTHTSTHIHTQFHCGCYASIIDACAAARARVVAATAEVMAAAAMVEERNTER